jgi:hypothetical protein
LQREITAMSDYGDFGHVETGHEAADLDHLHQEQGYEQDHNANYDAYGQEHNYENDQHYNHGHAVEYDNPSGEHYAEQDYTNYDSHVAESDAAFGEHYSEADHSQSFGDLDYLREHFDADFARGDFANFAQDSGQQELSAVSN